jgi:hypothetical protein
MKVYLLPDNSGMWTTMIIIITINPSVFIFFVQLPTKTHSPPIIQQLLHKNYKRQLTPHDEDAASASQLTWKNIDISKFGSGDGGSSSSFMAG